MENIELIFTIFGVVVMAASSIVKALQSLPALKDNKAIQVILTVLDYLSIVTKK